MDEKVDLQEVKYIPAQDGLFKPNVLNKKQDTFFLCFSVLSATLMVLSGGAAIAWSSPVIPKLKSNDTNVNPLSEPVTTFGISIMAGLPVIIGIPGSLLAPFLADFLGRKKSLYIIGFILFLCDIVVAFADRIAIIIAARCIFFVNFMITVSILTIYVIEISENHNRGKYGCLTNMFLPLGCLYSYLLGPCFSYRMFSLLSGAPLFFFLLLFWMTEESPVYLLSNGKKEECMGALRKLRSNKNEKELLEDFEEIAKCLDMRRNANNNWKASISLLFKSKDGRLALFLGSLPSIIQHASGAPIIIAFLGPIFSEAGMGMSGDTAAIILGIVKSLSFFITIFIVERAGRVSLFLFSALGCGFSLIIVGTCFYLNHIHSPIIENIRYFPLIFLIINIILYSFGIGPLPSTYMGELFSPELRVVGISITSTVLSIILFIFSSGFPILAEYAGMHWCMWIFSMNCFLGAALIYFLLPETKGKSIVEIQEILRNYKFRISGYQ